jgi:hypothetical protein
LLAFKKKAQTNLDTGEHEMKLTLALLGAAAALSIHAGVATAQVAIPGPNDPRAVAFIDPSQSLGSYSRGRAMLKLGQDPDGKNIQRDITLFPEPGYLDWKVNQFTFMRSSDPANPSRKAFRHKVVRGMSYRQDNGYQSARAAIAANWKQYNPAVLHDGVPYWLAFAFYVDTDHPFDGSGDTMKILDLGHSVSSKNTNALHALQLLKDGKLRLLVSSNNVLDGTNATAQRRAYDVPVTKGAWNYIVMQFKYEWDATKRPYTRLWRAVDKGTPMKIVDADIPNSYRESAGYHPWGDLGIYMWDVTDKGWGSSSTRTIYTKGIYILKDQNGTPTLSLDSMLALIRSK